MLSSSFSVNKWHQIERLIYRVSVLSPCVKEFEFRKPESGKFLVEESSIQKFVLVKSRILGFGIRNTDLRIRNPTYDCNPESKVHWQRIPNTAPGSRNPWRGIQNPRLSWIPFKGRVQVACRISTHMFDDMEWLPFQYNFKTLVYISVSSKWRKYTVTLTTDRLSCSRWETVMLQRKVGYTHCWKREQPNKIDHIATLSTPCRALLYCASDLRGVKSVSSGLKTDSVLLGRNKARSSLLRNSVQGSLSDRSSLQVAEVCWIVNYFLSFF